MAGGRAGRHLGVSILTMIVLSTAGLAACTDDATPPQRSSTTAPSPSLGSTSPPASPTATPPSAPKAEPTPKSAEAFVKYFWEVYNYSYATRDSKLLEEISSPTCLFCRDTSRAIRALVNNDQHIRGSEIELGVAVAPPTDPTAGIILATTISERPGATIEKDGSSTNPTKGVRNMKSEIALDWDGDGWVVRDLANDEKTGTPW